MFGSSASTNFPYNPSSFQSSSSTLLSETVKSKLHRCNTESVQMTKSSISETQKESTSHAITASPQQGYRGSWVSEIRCPFLCNAASVQMTKSSISETQKASTSHAIAASPQQRYRGVRQRHGGPWVSEIRHRPFSSNLGLGVHR